MQPDSASVLLRRLAGALTMLERAEIIDFNGHCSIRTGPDRFFINSGRSVRSKLGVEDIVEIDLEGNLTAGSDDPPMEFPLHAEIYRRRPDVQAIVHAHPKWSTLLTSAHLPYRPVFAQGCLPGDVPVFQNVLSVNSKEQGSALAEVLGEGRAALLQSHGVVVAGSDIREAFALTIYLEENAHRQYLAAQVADPYVFNGEEIAVCIRNLWKPNLFQKTWDYYFAKAGLDG